LPGEIVRENLATNKVKVSVPLKGCSVGDASREVGGKGHYSRLAEKLRPGSSNRNSGDTRTLKQTRFVIGECYARNSDGRPPIPGGGSGTSRQM